MECRLTRGLIALLTLLCGSAVTWAGNPPQTLMPGASIESDPFAADDPWDSGLFDPTPLRPHVSGHVLYEQIIEQCRSFRRNLAKIGKDASPDGRPQTCRLISFMRRQRWRDAGARRRFRLRPLVVPVVDLPVLRAAPLPVVALSAPAPLRPPPPPPVSGLKAIPYASLLLMLPRIVATPSRPWAPKSSEAR